MRKMNGMATWVKPAKKEMGKGSFDKASLGCILSEFVRCPSENWLLEDLRVAHG